MIRKLTNLEPNLRYRYLACDVQEVIFLSLTHPRAEYLGTKDQLHSLEPTKLFILANPRLSSMPCLGFPSAAPMKVMTPAFCF